ncbi:PaaI family thioesterase [Snodgrassella sp. CFCC 13594]|uniref:PaaI family thioesterase n=1 Tax=Snodgrassella sp. CFCC 13594 TaxID=1775559 RepID=UPI00082A92A7|nr:PaaI family thioesterase [Snodgrassella sp. CFCC 13594]
MPVNPQVFSLLFHHYAGLPHCVALGIRTESEQQDKPLMSVPWRPDLVGNEHTQTIHGGVITTLVDVTSASAVAALLPDFEVLATLDMRIDYMHPATPHDRIYAKAECYRLAGQVAFVRSHCYQHDESDPIALGTATFMRTPLGEREKKALREYLHQERNT